MWVTELLKDLSKRAKELGFPQDVKEGDWICYIELETNHLYLLTCPEVRNGYLSEEDYKGNYNLHVYKDNWFLILSFSRCLEWFFQNGVMYVMPFICNNHSHIERGRIDCLLPRDIETRTHDEVMAKAVVARLEK